MCCASRDRSAERPSDPAIRPDFGTNPPMTARATASAGIAALIAAPMWALFQQALGPDGFFQMFDRQDVLAMGIVTAFIGASAWVLQWCREVDAAPASQVAAVGFVSLAALLVVSCITILRQDTVHLWGGKTVYVVTYGAATLACATLMRSRLSARTARLARGTLSVFAPLLAVFALVAIRGLAAWPVSEIVAMPAMPAHRVPSTGRLVVILFDDLDRSYVFGPDRGNRPLPSFDALRREARSYKSVQSTGPVTQLAVPSLLTGKQVAKFVEIGREDANVEFGDSSRSVWSATRTIFDDATDARLKWGVAGWYLPYCRFRAASQSQICAWQSIIPHRVFDSGEAHLGASLVACVRSLLPFGRRIGHVELVDDLRESADRLAADPSIQFAFIHLPMPHSPYLYDPTRHRFRLWGGRYEDNVTLSDLQLGAMRARMEQTGVWDSSMVIVTSDHPHRDFSPHSASLREIPLLIRIPGEVPGGDIDRRITGAQMAQLFRRLVPHARSIPEMTAAVDVWQSAGGR